MYVVVSKPMGSAPFKVFGITVTLALFPNCSRKMRLASVLRHPQEEAPLGPRASRPQTAGWKPAVPGTAPWLGSYAPQAALSLAREAVKV